MRIYLITCVDSAGFHDGTETRHFYGKDLDEVIADAYQDYSFRLDDCQSEGILDASEYGMYTSDEFESEMRKAFDRTHYAGYITIQCVDSHIQYEANVLDV